MAILWCEVPLNKDRERIHRGREREAAAAAIELLVHNSTMTYEVYICAEVVGTKCRLYKHFVVAAKK